MLKMNLLLCVIGLAAAAAVLGSAPSSDGTVVTALSKLSLRDACLAFAAFVAPISSYYGPDLVVKAPGATRILMASMLCGSMAGTVGCSMTPSLNVGAHMGADGTVTGDVSLSLKDLQAQIGQAIKCELAALASENATYKTMTADEKRTHEKYQAAHKARLKILQSGKWAAPLDGSPNVISDSGSGQPPIIFPPVHLPTDTADTQPPATGPPQLRAAVLAGINDYPEAPLNGCLPDVFEVKAMLMEVFGFKESEITVLLNADAKAPRFKAEVDAAVKRVGGDPRNVVTWFSGHGSTFPIVDASGKDRVTNIICMHGFNWTEPTMLTSEQLIGSFSVISNQIVGAGFDSCHSENIVRVEELGNQKIVPRVFPHMPEAVRMKINRIRAKEAIEKTKELINGSVNIASFAGCEFGGTSADVQGEDGTWHGAFTHEFCKQMRDPAVRNLPAKDVVNKINAALVKDGFDQKCSVSGARCNKPFLK